MATIAKLNTMFTADGSVFNQVTNKLADRAKLLNGSLNPGFKSVAEGAANSTAAVNKTSTAMSVLRRVAVAAASAMALVFGAKAIANTVTGIVETYRFARSIGVTTNELYGMQQAFRDTGQAAGEAGPMLLELGRAMSAAATGGNSGMADTLDRLGLSAQRLAGMNPAEQFSEIAQALSQVRNANTRAALATQIFGDRTAELMKLISGGSKALDDARAKSEAMGNSISDSRAAQVEALAIKWENFTETIKGVGVTLASELIPFLTELASKLPSLGLTAGAVTGWIRNAFKAGGLLVQFLQGMHQFGLGVAKSVQFAFVAIMTGILGLVHHAIKIGGDMREALGMKRFANDFNKNLAGEIEGLFKAAKQEGRALGKEVADAFGKIGDTNGLLDISNAMENIRVNADKAGKAADDLNRNTGETAANINAALFKKGLDVFNETRTPLEKFRSRMTELDALVKSGAISWDTYARSSQSAVNELEKAYELTKAGFSAAVRGGTVDAYSLVVKAEQQEKTAREDPQKRMLRILEQSKAIDEGIRAEAKRTADAITSLKVVRI